MAKTRRANHQKFHPVGGLRLLRSPTGASAAAGYATQMADAIARFFRDAGLPAPESHSLIDMSLIVSDVTSQTPDQPIASLLFDLPVEDADQSR